ncbi:alpha/beta fold hydrolase [Polluticoccus soli]|uniref:alpha/beta fold hydrolase n=1 Tax=Polluticoccus soli TaxID=3034150 RepID=UPI0023E1C445|nr:alpha/beta fold hydrolase [Flavipsychrobacter sp. JY13-12]
MRLLTLLFVLLMFAFGAGAQKVSFEGLKEINGVKMYFKIIGEGEPLLVIHGGPAMNHDYLLPHLLPLAKTHKLIFYDQRASGRSDIPLDSIRAISHEIMVDDIDAIRKEFRLDKINILAHSWGAKLAINYALDYPENVGRLILSNPTTLSHEYDSLQVAAMAGKTTVANAERKKKLVTSKEFLSADLGVYKQVLQLNYLTSFFDTTNLAKLDIVLDNDFFRQNALLMRGLYRDYAKYDVNYYPFLRRVAVPVLILHGRADNIPLAADERLESSLANGTLVIFDSSGHFPFIEENGKFTQSVSAFLSSSN